MSKKPKKETSTENFDSPVESKRVKHTPTSRADLESIKTHANEILKVAEKVSHPDDKAFFELHINAIRKRVAVRIASALKSEAIEEIRNKDPMSFVNEEKPEPENTD